MNERLNILDELIESTTDKRGFDEFQAITASTTCNQTGEFKPNTLDRNTEWSLTLILRVNFWANQAQYHDARKIAEKVLVTKLYQDTLGDLAELRLQISNGNRMGAIMICDRIESKLT